MKLTRKISTCGVAVATLLTGIAFASGPPASAATSTIQPVVQARLADTRQNGNPDTKTVDGDFQAMGRRTAGTGTEIKIAGRANVPSDATAALINLTDVHPSGPNYLSVYPGPCIPGAPAISNVNSQPNQDTANSVFAKLGTGGTICVYTVQPTDFVIDINGYVPKDAGPTAIKPARYADTRTAAKGGATFDGKSVASGPLKAEGQIDVAIAGRGEVPSGAAAAVINLTLVQPTQNTYITVYPGPCLPKPPNASNVNGVVFTDTANNAFVQLGNNGLCVYSVYPTDFAIDVNGYVAAGSSPTSIKPARYADTRNGPNDKTFDGQFQALGLPKDLASTEVKIAGRGEVPATANAAIVNVTGASPAQGTFLTVYPAPCLPAGTIPATSTVNIPAKTDRANNTYVQLGANGSICVFDKFASHFAIDVNGYLTTTPAPYVCPTTGTITAAECQALVALYNNTNGVNWTNKTDWLVGADPCKWFGVTCTAGKVTALKLPKNKLAGKVPAEIGNLTSLTALDLNTNSLTSVPADLGKLTALTELNVSGNKLTALPAEVGNLTKLTMLAADANQLTAVPAEVGKLTALTVLKLGTNQLATLPADLGKLTNLTELNVSANKLTALPAEVGNLTKLTTLAVDSNQLTAVPVELAPKLTNLTTLTAAKNKFTTLPAGIGQFAKLTTLALEGNQLTALPNELGNLKLLTSLTLADNKLTGDISGPFDGLVKANTIKTLTLSGNGCLTANATVKPWLDTKDPKWKNAGCP